MLMAANTRAMKPSDSAMRPQRTASLSAFLSVRRQLATDLAGKASVEDIRAKLSENFAIAKRVFSPKADEVAWAERVVEAMPDGTGVAMLDGKMQDDATWKQAKVMVDLARAVAAKDPAMAAAYGL